MHPSDARWKVSTVALEVGSPDPAVVLQEHEGVEPRSYMAVSNLQAIQHAAKEILGLMNEQDELPAWTEQMISEAKANLSKARDYIMGEKSQETE